MQRTRTRPPERLPSWGPWALLIVGTGAASTSAIFIRYASEAPALSISFWRCFAGALALLPFALPRLRTMTRAELMLPMVAGVFLAVHFATWIRSLELTTVAAAVLLVASAPVFVALSARVFLSERLVTAGWIGIAVAIAGTALIGGTDHGGATLSGNLLALIGGATAGGYMLAGQQARRSLGILEYAVVTYSVAAVLLFASVLWSGSELVGYEARTWWAIVALVIGPQLLGHTVINLVLSDIDATTVSVTVMAEPVIAISLAFILFSEVPSWLVYPGGVAILTGIYLVSRARRSAMPLPD